jgi:hypothetical protein
MNAYEFFLVGPSEKPAIHVRIREGIIRLHTTWLVFCLREKVEQVLL